MTVVFVSDATNPGRGFSATWRAVPVNNEGDWSSFVLLEDMCRIVYQVNRFF